MSGLVVIVSANRVVTNDLSEEEKQVLITKLQDIYGVTSENIEESVDYLVTGTTTMVFPTDMSEQEATAFMTETLSKVLDVHPHEIQTTVNLETGDVSFTIMSDDYDTSVNVLKKLNLQEEKLKEELEKTFTGILVDEFEIASDVSLHVVFDVNVDNTTTHLVLANYKTSQMLGDEQFTTKIEGTSYIYFVVVGCC